MHLIEDVDGNEVDEQLNGTRNKHLDLLWSLALDADSGIRGQCDVSNERTDEPKE